MKDHTSPEWTEADHQATEPKPGALDVEAIRARLAAATPGPWWLWSRTNDVQPPEHYPEHTVGFCGVGTYARADSVMPQTAGMTYLRPADAVFLEHAPADLAALLGLVARLQIALVNTVIPLEVIVMDEDANGPMREISPTLRAKILEGVQSARAALAPDMTEAGT